MFSEFYFYMPCLYSDIDKESHFTNKDDSFPTIYRIDRIRLLRYQKRHLKFHIVTASKKESFASASSLCMADDCAAFAFIYKGSSVEAVLDRLPTAQIIAKRPEGYLISAEVFGDGIDMWIRSQGNMVEVVK